MCRSRPPEVGGHSTSTGRARDQAWPTPLTRSSTPRPTRPRPSPPPRCCRSSRRSPPPPASRSSCATSRSPPACWPRSRSPSPTISGCRDDLAELGALVEPARGQRHQAAEHLGLDPPAQGHHRGAAGQGLRRPRVPRRAQDAGGARDQGPLRQDQGLGGEPGAARGQLRSPGPRLGEALRPQATRTRWAPGRPTRRPTSPTWTAATSTPTSSRSPSPSPAPLKVELVGADGTVTVLKESIPVLAGEVVDATFMSAKALDAFLAAQLADARRRACCSRSTSRPR